MKNIERCKMKTIFNIQLHWTLLLTFYFIHFIEIRRKLNQIHIL